MPFKYIPKLPSQMSSLFSRVRPRSQKCKVCATLVEIIESCQGEEFKTWDLGTYSEVFDDLKCEHQDFLRRLLRGYRNFECLTVSLYKNSLSLCMEHIEPDEKEESGKFFGLTAGLLVMGANETVLGLRAGRQLDADYINLNLIRKWISYCDNNHGLACKQRTTVSSVTFDWLVDVESNCIVAAPEKPSFFALSYVWGQVPTLKTTKANLATLRQYGSLAGTKSKTIPATIRHAMGLTRGLGRRYLWVDSLCIVQDDEESLRRHIANMASIFNSADMTIVASDGKNANHGLQGLRYVSKPRKGPPVLKLSNSLRLTARVEHRIANSFWSQRGWTLQESLFSRRKLVFIGGTVRWICQSNDYYEEIDSPLDLAAGTVSFGGAHHNETLSIRELHLTYPDMSKLFDLLAHYSRRTLTFDADVLSAISSTLGALHEAFPSGFIHGLPVSFLDMSLIWRASSMLCPRQVASQDDRLPSWTWAGWKGQMDMLSWTSAAYLKNPPFNWGRAHHRPFQPIPILVWHTCRNKSERPVPIPHCNEWYKYKREYMGKSTDLPLGWHYHLDDLADQKAKIEERRASDQDLPNPSRFDDEDCPIDSVDSDELLTPYFYSHDSAPALRFWHPVPIGSHICANSDLANSPSGRYLWAKTQQAILWAAKPRPSPPVPLAVSMKGPDEFVAPLFSTMLAVTVVLRDKEEIDVGELQVDMEADYDRIRTYERSDGQPGLACDLVAISRGFDFASPMEPEKEVYTFYNVLWVVWEDGIAYRRGVGRVKRKVWEALERHNIELLLG